MAAPHFSPTDRDKQVLRAALRARRAAPGPAMLAALEAFVAEAIARLNISPARKLALAAFLPIGSEPDLSGLLQRLHHKGGVIGVPDTPANPGPLIFRHWSPGCTLRPGRFGTLVPDAPAMLPDIVLVPLLGFDARLHRLGYGGGFYDRTLAALPQARSIGVGLEALLLDTVPVGPHDIALDAVATEARLRMRGEAV